MEMPPAPGIVQRNGDVAGVAGADSVLAAHWLPLDGRQTGKIRNPRHLSSAGPFHVRPTRRSTGRFDWSHQFECGAVSSFFCFVPPLVWWPPPLHSTMPPISSQVALCVSPLSLFFYSTVVACNFLNKKSFTSEMKWAILNDPDRSWSILKDLEQVPYWQLDPVNSVRNLHWRMCRISRSETSLTLRWAAWVSTVTCQQPLGPWQYATCTLIPSRLPIVTSPMICWFRRCWIASSPVKVAAVCRPSKLAILTSVWPSSTPWITACSNGWWLEVVSK